MRQRQWQSFCPPSLPRSFPHPLGLGLGSPSNTPLEVQDLPELLRAAKYLIVTVLVRAPFLSLYPLKDTLN